MTTQYPMCKSLFLSWLLILAASPSCSASRSICAGHARECSGPNANVRVNCFAQGCQVREMTWQGILPRHLNACVMRTSDPVTVLPKAVRKDPPRSHSTAQCSKLPQSFPRGRRNPLMTVTQDKKYARLSVHLFHHALTPPPACSRDMQGRLPCEATPLQERLSWKNLSPWTKRMTGNNRSSRFSLAAQASL